MNRREILETALDAVTRDREATHGRPEQSFGLIAALWSEYLGAALNSPIEPHDVALMMALLKIARLRQNPEHADSWLDGAGYFACGGELATGDPEVSQAGGEESRCGNCKRWKREDGPIGKCLVDDAVAAEANWCNLYEPIEDGRPSCWSCRSFNTDSPPHMFCARDGRERRPTDHCGFYAREASK